MDAFWNSLLANFAIFVLFVFLCVQSQGWQSRFPPRCRAAGFGLWFGFCAIGLMQLRTEMQDDVYVDLRAASIAIAGLFGGPLAGTIAGTLAVAYRVWQGGTGTVGGCATIVLATAVGIIGHLRLKGRAPDGYGVVALAGATAIAGLARFLWLPWPVMAEVLMSIAPPLAALTFVATVFASLTFVQERRRRDATEANRIYLESELAFSQRYLAEALAHMADGLAVFDRDGRLVFSNDQYRAMFPRTADLRVPGAHIRDILRGVIERREEDIPPESAQAWIEALCASLRGPGSRQFGLADGRWLEARRRVTEDGGCLMMTSDVTLAKVAEASLVAANLQLDTLARTDAMTGLMNRRAFDDTLCSVLARCAGEGLPLSLLLIDVDFFKGFNDTYGHPAGDACLRGIAACLKAALPYDSASATRYGGEEFAVILPDADGTEAAQVAERLRLAVRGLGIAHTGSPMDVVTVSVGAAVVVPTADFRASDIVRIADRALYDAKAGGRDTVSLSSSGESDNVRRSVA